MKVVEVLQERGWSNHGWEDDGKVCIAHAVSIATEGLVLAINQAGMIHTAIVQVSGDSMCLIGNWNDYHATYEDVMLVAKLIDQELEELL